MSKSTDKSKQVAAGNAGKKPSGASAATFLFFFVAGFAASLVAGWVVFPKLLYSEKKQPFDFNHETHVEMLGDDCESCHFFRDDGSYAGVPSMNQCIDCHEDLQGDSSDEEIFVRDYVKAEKEVPWLIYSKQPDCVFFSHAAHVKKAEMECAECHGDIGESESLKPYQENRLTGYSRDIWGYNIAGIAKNSQSRMKMDDCGSCHLERMGSKGSCFQCHK